MLEMGGGRRRRQRRCSAVGIGVGIGVGVGYLLSEAATMSLIILIEDMIDETSIDWIEHNGSKDELDSAETEVCRTPKPSRRRNSGSGGPTMARPSQNFSIKINAMQDLVTLLSKVTQIGQSQPIKNWVVILVYKVKIVPIQ